VAHVALLATDLVDAAGLYERWGDTQAFGILHEYFRVLEEEIRREGGAMVKTINEGLLAAFHNPAAAARVAIDLQELLDRNSSTQGLNVHVGIHYGPAMVATINGKLDYFGSTVKLALRLPSLARDNCVVLSQALVSDPQVQSLLSERGLICEVADGAEGMPGDGIYYRVGVKPKNKPASRLGAQRPACELEYAQTPVV
jgi:class 3 adenylate cyclase